MGRRFAYEALQRPEVRSSMQMNQAQRASENVFISVVKFIASHLVGITCHSVFTPSLAMHTSKHLNIVLLSLCFKYSINSPVRFQDLPVQTTSLLQFHILCGHSTSLSKPSRSLFPFTMHNSPYFQTAC
jgi:hypothetical protein